MPPGSVACLSVTWFFFLEHLPPNSQIHRVWLKSCKVKPENQEYISVILSADPVPAQGEDLQDNSCQGVSPLFSPHLTVSMFAFISEAILFSSHNLIGQSNSAALYKSYRCLCSCIWHHQVISMHSFQPYKWLSCSWLHYLAKLITTANYAACEVKGNSKLSNSMLDQVIRRESKSDNKF